MSKTAVKYYVVYFENDVRQESRPFETWDDACDWAFDQRLPVWVIREAHETPWGLGPQNKERK